jgi:OTU domain-containing protein 6
VEADFAAKFQELKAKYELEGAGEETVVDPKTDHSETTTTVAVGQAPPPPLGNNTTEEETEQQLFQRKKVEKAARKREQARQKELQDQQALAAAKALPNAKDTELESMQLPDRAMIVEVLADGHCLYRAIAAQLDDTNNNNNGNKNKNTNDYQHVRQVAADALLRYRDSLADFCESSHYDDYVDRVRNSADWGGHLELRALSLAFQRPIVVYSTGPPLTIGGGDDDVVDNDEARDNNVEPIRLSYHLHYYALGEHYNRVVIQQETPETDGDAAESS